MKPYLLTVSGVWMTVMVDGIQLQGVFLKFIIVWLVSKAGVKILDSREGKKEVVAFADLRTELVEDKSFRFKLKAKGNKFFLEREVRRMS